MGLRIIKRFNVDNALRLTLLQIRPGEIVEILLRAQHIGTLVIKIQEFLQVIEGIGLSQHVNVAPRQFNAVAPSQCKHQFRLKRPFQV
jgi:hypothetical protein